MVSPTLSAISVGLCRRGDGTGVAFSAAMVNQETASPAAPISLDDRLRELESNLILWALKVSNGNKSKAAELLQIKRSTLGDRINRCGLGAHDTDAAPASTGGEGPPLHADVA